MIRAWGATLRYRGYEINANWLEGQGHWVMRVTFRGEWVDSFLTSADAKEAIDSWTASVEDGGLVR